MAAELVVQGFSLAPLWVVIGLLMRILIRILSGILIRILIRNLIMTHQGSREQPGNHQLTSELVVLAVAPDPPGGGHQDPLEPVILYFLLTVTHFLYFFLYFACNCHTKSLKSCPLSSKSIKSIKKYKQSIKKV